MASIIMGTGGNVVLRKLTKEDIPNLAKHANNEKVSINLRDGFPKLYTIENAESFIEIANSQNQTTIFAIEYQGNYVGNISLMIGSDVYRKSAEIGYFIGEPFWNKGIATQAVNLITEFGFKELNIIRIHTGIFDYNKSSQRVLEKCGFTKEGIFQKAICKNGKIYDEIRYAKLKNE